MTKRLIALALMLCLLFSCALAEDARYGQVYDTAQDVGKLTVRYLWLGPQVADDKPGDCMILTSPDGKIMVLDAGHPQSTQYVIAALDEMGVKKIDYLVASHPHIDHIGGMAALMDRYEVGIHYSTELWHTTNTYKGYVAAIERNHIEQVYLHEGDSFMFGDQVKVYVYNPEAEIEYYEDYPKSGTQFMNNHSLVLKFVYGDSSFLMAGDLYSTGETDVVKRWGDELHADVIKANHHGLDTSNSPKWRKTVNPEITVITNDLLGSVFVAQKYARNGKQMYHIFLDGDVRVSTAGDGEYEVLTGKDRQTDFFD